MREPKKGDRVRLKNLANPKMGEYGIFSYKFPNGEFPYEIKLDNYPESLSIAKREEFDIIPNPFELWKD